MPISFYVSFLLSSNGILSVGLVLIGIVVIPLIAFSDEDLRRIGGE